MKFTDWLLNQNYTRKDYLARDIEDQIDLISRYLLGDDYA